MPIQNAMKPPREANEGLPFKKGDLVYFIDQIARQDHYTPAIVLGYNSSETMPWEVQFEGRVQRLRCMTSELIHRHELIFKKLTRGGNGEKT